MCFYGSSVFRDGFALRQRFNRQRTQSSQVTFFLYFLYFYVYVIGNTLYVKGSANKVVVIDFANYSHRDAIHFSVGMIASYH